MTLFTNNRLGKAGEDAYQPLAETARATDIKPIWRATSAEALQRALDHAQITIFAATIRKNGSAPQN
jgi:hypothetical protein